jgi:NADH-quinone oxidoreductase subunit L
MSPEQRIAAMVATAPAWPAAGAVAIGAALTMRKALAERSIARVATAALGLSALGTAASAAAWVAGGLRPIDVRLGHWFRAGDYGFEVAFLLDGPSVIVSLLVSILLLATCKFSANYLHREPGFARFFALMLTFGAGMQLLVLGGSYDLLFAGWELVGITSVLLVAFFHERTAPVRAAIRVLVTYRLCDVGLLLAAVLLHRSAHSTVFSDVFGGHAHAGPLPATAVGVALLLAAMGKSAQFPTGGWLPRAMEGPTASSAVFYGGLSVHAGVYLLIRSQPLLDQAPAARALVVLVGAVTAVMGGLSGQASPDAKSSLAYATISQVGLMFVECGLGLPSLALAHLCAHALLRYYQFLRTPSILQDALARRAAPVAPRTAGTSGIAALWQARTLGLRRFLYRLAIERFEVEATLERWIVRPTLGLSSALDRLDQSALDALEPKGPDPEGQGPGSPPEVSAWRGGAARGSP